MRSEITITDHLLLWVKFSFYDVDVAKLKPVLWVSDLLGREFLGKSSRHTTPLSFLVGGDPPFRLGVSPSSPVSWLQRNVGTLTEPKDIIIKISDKKENSSTLVVIVFTIDFIWSSMNRWVTKFSTEIETSKLFYVFLWQTSNSVKGRLFWKETPIIKRKVVDFRTSFFLVLPTSTNTLPSCVTLSPGKTTTSSDTREVSSPKPVRPFERSCYWTSIRREPGEQFLSPVLGWDIDDLVLMVLLNSKIICNYCIVNYSWRILVFPNTMCFFYLNKSYIISRTEYHFLSYVESFFMSYNE